MATWKTKEMRGITGFESLDSINRKFSVALGTDTNLCTGYFSLILGFVLYATTNYKFRKKF